ncbi:MAG TPA: thiamine-phosphate kinase [Dictyobacter sp.]|jgi:thiamine-monophosphate kinase|nr:thiamine-phosphate kinase [Dictyobacter sp.]
MDISALSEFALIARLTEGLAISSTGELGVGDDCAVLDPGGEDLLLATTDSQIEEVHFSLQTALPEQIGRKALAINISDIAAMGGRPRYALISLVLPAHLPLQVLDGIYAGLRQEAAAHQVAVVGGNIAGTGKTERLVLDITLLGSIERGRVISRAGARVGDLLCVTGTLGDSAAGLATLIQPIADGETAAVHTVQARHRTPTPRVHEGRVLSRLGPQVVTAMLDISDGLSGDLQHLCIQSVVGATLEVERLPLSPALRTVATWMQRDPLTWVLHGGEDYELLFTVAPDRCQEVIDAVRMETGTSVTVIGEITTASTGLRMHHAQGQYEDLPIQSWDHLQHMA